MTQQSTLQMAAVHTKSKPGLKRRIPATPLPFLTLDRASFRLGDRLVFENTSWVFNRNEHWGIVGENGSGKSLFADAARGRLPLVHGELAYHFSPANGLSPEECIGHVSFEDRKEDVHEQVVQSRWNSFEEEQGTTINDFLSYESVMEVNPFEANPWHRKKKQRFEQRRRRAVRLLRIEPLLERRLVSLSNGETQKVRLARALCGPLRLLILDEPFNGLDRKSRTYFQDVLGQLMATPIRILSLTTLPEDLPPGITHVMRVENCKVAAAGPRNQVLAAAARRRLKQAREIVADPRQQAGADQRLLTSSPTIEMGRGRELVRMRNVTVRYGKATVLRNLNWTIRAGESWALLGPNGSGKTTLLSLIVGDHPQAYANDVTVFGRRRGTGESVWELKQQIGWISPELHLHFDDQVTCLAAVESGFKDTIGVFERVTPGQRKLARRSLKRFGLLSMADHPLFEISAGLQRMALLARALVKKPRLLILDEPCQGLDAAHRELFLRTVDGLIRSGAETVVYVTHREEEIPRSIKRTLRLP